MGYCKFIQHHLFLKVVRDLALYFFARIVYATYMQTTTPFLRLIIAVALLIGIVIFPKLTKSPTCANSISCIKNLTGTYEKTTKGVFLGKAVYVPQPTNNETNNKTFVASVLGTASGDSKHIYVDLATQTLTAKEGDKEVLQFPVSTGKWGRTPTGDFRIWIKLRYTRMSGGEGADYYDLPNVPYVMFFYNKDVAKSMGYSLHGAYWHNNFGHTMSHGCVNIRPEDAEKLYNWAEPPTDGKITYAKPDNEGTLVTISGTPKTD